MPLVNKDSGNCYSTCLDSTGCPIFLKISARIVLEPGGKVVEACICVMCVYLRSERERERDIHSVDI